MTMWRPGHPAESVLSLFIDGGLSPEREERVRQHLGDCAACSETVEFLSGLGEVARQPVAVEVPDVVDAVLERRRRGDRVLLDTRPRRRTREFGPRAAAAVALLCVTGVSALLLLAPSAGASRGELHINPDAPAAGATIEFTYVPAFYLADQDSLRLRARARKSDTPFPRGGLIGELRVSTLHRNDRGEFTGQIRLEPDDVFLAAAVEDFDAENVDTNFGKLWEVLVVEETGEPSLAAIESKYRVLEPYNWVMASAWAKEITARWPDNPFGWALLYWHESRVGAGIDADSLLEAHRERLGTLIRDTVEPSADRLEWLARYAGRLGEAAVQDSLLEILAAVDPTNEAVIDREVNEAVHDSIESRQRRLALLDEAWMRSGETSESAVRLALGQAALSGDMRAVDLWLERAVATPGVGAAIAVSLVEPFDELASERAGMYRSRLEAARSADDQGRTLRQSADEYRASLAADRSFVSGKLAAALASAGDTIGALQLYEELSGEAWAPSQIEPFIDLLLAVGDTVSALQGIGMLVTDPIEGSAASRQYGNLIDRLLTPEDLAGLRTEYVRRAVESLGEPRPIGDVELQPGLPTVALLWDPGLAGADAILDEFNELASTEWTDGRIRTVIVINQVDEASTAMLGDVRSAIVLDPDFLIAQGARAFTLPAYVVLNGSLQAVGNPVAAAGAFRLANAVAITTD